MLRKRLWEMAGVLIMCVGTVQAADCRGYHGQVALYNYNPENVYCFKTYQNQSLFIEGRQYNNVLKQVVYNVTASADVHETWYSVQLSDGLFWSKVESKDSDYYWLSSIYENNQAAYRASISGYAIYKKAGKDVAHFKIDNAVVAINRLSGKLSFSYPFTMTHKEKAFTGKVQFSGDVLPANLEVELYQGEKLSSHLTMGRNNYIYQYIDVYQHFEGVNYAGAVAKATRI